MFLSVRPCPEAANFAAGRHALRSGLRQLQWRAGGGAERRPGVPGYHEFMAQRLAAEPANPQLRRPTLSAPVIIHASTYGQTRHPC